MSTTLWDQTPLDHDVSEIMGDLYGRGITALKGAFSRAFAARMREDIEALFEAARRVPEGGARGRCQREVPEGALPRGPERYYVEVPPERVRGFVDIATHPWFVRVCEAALGP